MPSSSPLTWLSAGGTSTCRVSAGAARLSLLLAALALVAVAEHGASTCPCANASLCGPLPGPALRKKEVFGFGPPASQFLERATTVAWASPGDAELLCAAHAEGVRLVARDNIFRPTPITGDGAVRSAWVAGTVRAIVAAHLDGITFDWEAPVARGSAAATHYLLLVAETTKALKRLSPSFQVTVCAAWAPDDVDGRAYDYAALSRASDALYVMAYDMQSQITGPCIAAANAPYFGAARGLGRYLDLGIPASKLILGVPWYGYRYECLLGTGPGARFCPIRSVPFRGVNCSDAAGSQLGHDVISRRLRGDKAATPRRWDTNQLAPFFNTVEAGRVVQYHYDDPQSLALKYRLARTLGLRGVGPYQFAFSNDTAMWEALEQFFSAPAPEREAQASAIT